MKIQLKRSNVLQFGVAKEPTAPQMEYGELAVNYSETDPAIFIKDSSNNIVRIAGSGNISDDGQVEVPATSNPPASPKPGNLWYNAEDGRLYVYYEDANSSQWVDASPDGWNAAEDGASIHVGDTPPATPLEGSLWWNTTDNTLYIYYIDATSEQWVTASPSGSIDVDDFVAVAGDNMTGNLTLGNDKITLYATDGGASFASKAIVIGDLPAGTFANVQLKPNGQIHSSADNANFYASSQVVTNGAKIRLEDGSPGATDKYHLYANAANGGLVTIATDGSASFAGVVSTDGAYVVNTNSAGDIFLVKQGGTPTAFIKGDGTASFAGNLNIGDYAALDATKTGVRVSSAGVVYAKPSSTNTTDLFRGYKGNDIVFKVEDDGSSNFAGNLSVGGDATNTSKENGVYIGKVGVCFSRSSSANQSSFATYFSSETNPRVNIKTGGDATFSGTVTENATRSGSVEILLEADDDTKYTSTTDSEGVVTRVYNGEVLDVKARLTKADNALKALKTAAAAAADFASLQSAIATALADI